ncbi:MAG: FIST C-terminal domain-containing protein [Myxococcales bacterium]|nr:FIST C-terminal domain-containing protein [Myxococcales bacterium]
MLNVVVAHSLDPDARFAAEELVEQSAAQQGERAPGVALLLSAIDVDHAALLEALARAYPELPLIGCTTDGELSSREGFSEGSTTLMMMTSDTLEFGVGVGRGLSRDPAAAAAAAVAQARASMTSEPSACVIVPESLTASATQALAGLRAALGETFPILGGLASDQWRFKQTSQFFKTEVLHDALPILLIGGPARVSWGVASGWRALGEPQRVTESDGNVVARIGDRSALDYYKYYLGDHMLPSGESPLAVLEPSSERHYLRAPLAYDAERGTITFAGDVPLNATVQLTSASRDEIIAASRAATEEAKRGYPGDKPEAALVFSCAARKQLLGTRTREEEQIVKQTLALPVPVCGFYAYGEFAPLGVGHAAQFHNETIVAMLLGTE